jgi:hypothetical protein
MKSSESLEKLAPALIKAQAEFKAVGKSGHNKFDKYDYANLEDYISTVREVLAKHGLGLLSSSEDVSTLADRTTKSGGTEHAVIVKLVSRIVHESGEWIETCSVGEGQDRADKSVYKAITGARKYAIAATLNLATTDDPEQDDDHEPPPSMSAKQTTTKKQDLTAQQMADIAELQQQINLAKSVEVMDGLREIIKAQSEPVKAAVRPLFATRLAVLETQKA